jgi:hypothetical protein
MAAWLHVEFLDKPEPLIILTVKGKPHESEGRKVIDLQGSCPRIARLPDSTSHPKPLSG